MKKMMMMVLVIASLLVTGLVVYAESDEVEIPEWFNDMMEWRRDEIDQAVEDGSLTEEEAEARLEKMDEMEEFHLEEGFDNYGEGSCPRAGKAFGGNRSGRGCGGGSRGISFSR